MATETLTPIQRLTSNVVRLEIDVEVAGGICIAADTLVTRAQNSGIALDRREAFRLITRELELFAFGETDHWQRFKPEVIDGGAA